MVNLELILFKKESLKPLVLPSPMHLYSNRRDTPELGGGGAAGRAQSASTQTASSERHQLRPPHATSFHVAAARAISGPRQLRIRENGDHRLQSEDQHTEKQGSLLCFADASTRTSPSGEQCPHLLRGPVQDALWVSVFTDWVHHSSIHFTIGSAD